jgi:hypothetical protein
MSNSHAEIKLLANDLLIGPARTQKAAQSELQSRTYGSGADIKDKTNHARMHSPARPFHDHNWITEDIAASNTPHGVTAQRSILCVDDGIEGTRMRGEILEAYLTNGSACTRSQSERSIHSESPKSRT